MQRRFIIIDEGGLFAGTTDDTAAADVAKATEGYEVIDQSMHVPEFVPTDQDDDGDSDD